MSAWANQIFNSKIAKRGGVVRRKIASIERYTSQDELKEECKKRGFHVVRHGDQWLIFCDEAEVKIVV